MLCAGAGDGYVCGIVMETMVGLCTKTGAPSKNNQNIIPIVYLVRWCGSAEG